MLYNQNDILIFELYARVDHSISYRISIPDIDISTVVIDFKNTNYITLSGVLYIICLVEHLNRKARKSNKEVYTEIINIDQSLIQILMNWGVFTEMAAKGNLFKVNSVDIIINTNFLNIEKRYIEHHLAKGMSSSFFEKVIMPISTIPQGEKRYNDFLGTFTNQMINFYSKLKGLKSFDIGKMDEEVHKDFGRFYHATKEIIQNISDHSESWGLGGIQANADGVQISYYDVGIGIIKSMQQKSQFKDINDIEILRKAFSDAMSSKSGDQGYNRGRGFSTMQEFVNNRNGYLSVRTDKYHFINGKLHGKAHWFPGTQVVIYYPNSFNEN